jgi:hypothetical protein
VESNFNIDLSNESLLANYLDAIYPTLFNGFEIDRKKDLENQHKGIDIIISKNDVNYFIDEKAQLDYVGKDLPTFAFEISYIKDGVQKLGWLYDNSKLTDKYFLITAIYLNEPNDFTKGFKSCKITSVDRSSFLELLNSKKLSFSRLSDLNNQIRNGINEGGIQLDELDYYSEGKLFFSKTNKSEQPINLVLKLDFLINSGVAKRVI